MLITKKPEFVNDIEMDITAYMGPRRAGKRNFNGKYGENPRDDKNGYPSFITDDVFELYKDAGLNILMPEADAYYGQNITENGYVLEPDFEKSDLFEYMKLAEKHDIQVYPAVEEVFGNMTHVPGPFGDREKAIIKDFVETVQKHCPKSFGGIMLTDEPTYKTLDRVKKIVDYLKSDEIAAIKPDMKFFTAMLPSYADLHMLDSEFENFRGKTEFNEDRVKAFTSYMVQCTDALGEFGCDYYCLNRQGRLSPGFYQNMEIMAEYGRDNGHDVFITLLSCRMDVGYNYKTGKGVTVFPIPSYEEIRFQVYSAMAFGMMKLGYFTFWQHYHEGTNETFPKAMVNYEPSAPNGYRPTEIYYAVKEVNQEIRAIDHIFMHYKWQGCKVIAKSREKNTRLVKGGYDKGCITKMSANRDLLVGCFTRDTDNTEGYWIVNAQNPYQYEMNDVSITFEGADRVVYYRAGREYDKALKDGIFEIRLGVGEGVFAVPYCE